MVARLAPEAERGVPIVGCEPSCLLTLREEFLALLPGDPRAQAVAAQARLVEELLVEAIDDGALALRADAASPAADPLPRPLPPEGADRHRGDAGAARRIPGAEVDELDAGCCGMAGSFGFEAEHYDLSMKIGEHRLFPAVRGRAGGHAGRRHRRLVPPADRPRRGAPRMASCRAREGRDVIRWGIIGTGGIATTFAADLALTELRDASSPSARARRRAPTRSASASASRNRHDAYEALVDDPEVDAVYVARRTRCTTTDALLALRRRQARAGREAVHDERRRGARSSSAPRAQRGSFLMEAMWTRFLPHMREIRRAARRRRARRVVDRHRRPRPVVRARPGAPAVRARARRRRAARPRHLPGVVRVDGARRAGPRRRRSPTRRSPASTRQTSILLGYESGAHARAHTARCGASARRAPRSSAPRPGSRSTATSTRRRRSR